MTGPVKKKKLRKSPGHAALICPVRVSSPRGRPRQLDESERRRRLIEAAEKVFVQMGYGAANVDDIAGRAAMSKKTLYQVFPTKESLFAAVIESRRAALAAMIDADASDQSRAPDDVLRRFLRQVAR